MRLPLLTLRLSTGRYTDFVNEICDLAGSQSSSYVCVANAHMVVEAHYDKTFAADVNKADIVTPDGKPLAWAIRLLYALKQQRVAGMDLLPDLLKAASLRELPVYFYGSTQEIIDKTVKSVNNGFPGIRIVGAFSPPFRKLNSLEEQSVIDNINISGAKIVFVALGCPKQEKWMASMKNRINACMVGIGGALPVMIGMQKRAPQWMQRISLEWLYRLVQEPRRLFKRYAVTNSIFLVLLFKQWVRQGFIPCKIADSAGSPPSRYIRVRTGRSQETAEINES